jgi:3',5'-cyclic AMP phosphodiesterase CpdA
MMKKAHHVWSIIIVLVWAAGCRSPEKNELSPPQKDTASQRNEFHFFILGDWGRRGKASQQAVADQMIVYARQTHPAFIITTGDNFYQEGVRSVNDPHWNLSFTHVYKELTRDYDWYPVLGNHDYEGRGNPKAEIDYQQVNPRWHMPFFYSTMVVSTADSQRVRFLFIDTSPFSSLYYKPGEYPMIVQQDTAQQRRWIETTLANAREEWKIVVGHHPVYSAGCEHGNTPELIRTLQPLLKKYKVQAYISGHEHNMQHLQPAHSDVDYFVCGNGSDIIPVCQFERTRFGAGIPGFADLAIRNDSLFLTFIDKDGQVKYHYSRKR